MTSTASTSSPVLVSGVPGDLARLVRLLEVLDLFLSERNIEATLNGLGVNTAIPTHERWATENSPRMSSRLDRLVVPMMGAVTPGLERIHAKEICAMLTPFFFAISSILRPGVSRRVSLIAIHQRTWW